MDTQEKSPCPKRNGKEVSFEFKIFVIEQINNGQISLNYASKLHPRNTYFFLPFPELVFPIIAKSMLMMYCYIL